MNCSRSRYPFRFLVASMISFRVSVLFSLIAFSSPMSVRQARLSCSIILAVGLSWCRHWSA